MTPVEATIVWLAFCGGTIVGMVATTAAVLYKLRHRMRVPPDKQSE